MSQPASQQSIANTSQTNSTYVEWTTDMEIGFCKCLRSVRHTANWGNRCNDFKISLREKFGVTLTETQVRCKVSDLKKKVAKRDRLLFVYKNEVRINEFGRVVLPQDFFPGQEQLSSKRISLVP